MKKIDSGGSGSQVMFEGPNLKGWTPDQKYSYTLEVYGDAQYQTKLETLNQQAVCVAPPR